MNQQVFSQFWRIERPGSTFYQNWCMLCLDSKMILPLCNHTIQRHRPLLPSSKGTFYIRVGNILMACLFIVGICEGQLPNTINYIADLGLLVGI